MEKAKEQRLSECGSWNWRCELFKLWLSWYCTKQDELAQDKGTWGLFIEELMGHRWKQSRVGCQSHWRAGSQGPWNETEMYVQKKTEVQWETVHDYTSCNCKDSDFALYMFLVNLCHGDFYIAFFTSSLSAVTKDGFYFFWIKVFSKRTCKGDPSSHQQKRWVCYPGSKMAEWAPHWHQDSRKLTHLPARRSANSTGLSKASWVALKMVWLYET